MAIRPNPKMKRVSTLFRSRLLLIKYVRHLMSGLSTPDLEHNKAKTDVASVRWSRRTGRIALMTVFILVALLLFGARDILGPFVWAGILAYALNPIVNLLSRTVRAPRQATVALLYVITVGLVVLGSVLLVPRVVAQINEVVERLPELVNQIDASLPETMLGEPVSMQGLLDSAADGVTGLLSDTAAALRAFRTAFQGVLHVLLALVAAGYLLLAGPHLIQNLISLFPTSQQAEIKQLVTAIDKVFGGFIRGEIVLVVIMSIMTYIGLSIIGIPFALILALATGILELIPVFGPLIAAIPPIGLALVVNNNFGWPGWVAATVVAAMYTILRQTEDYFVIPNVIGRVVRVHPLIALFAIFAGLQIWGVTGMVIALPVAGVARVLLLYVYRRTVSP